MEPSGYYYPFFEAAYSFLKYQDTATLVASITSPVVKEEPVMTTPAYIPAPYEEGQEVRVKFDGEILSAIPQKNGTTIVTEPGTGIVHYLYLYSSALGLTGLTAGPSAVDANGDIRTAGTAGDMISVDFTAMIQRSSNENDPVGTRMVYDNYGAGRGSGYIHYLNLSSPSITPVVKEEEPAMPAPAPAPVYAENQEIRIKFDATITKKGGQRSSTSEVMEDGNGILHYLYLPSDGLNLVYADEGREGRAEGARISVDFKAIVKPVKLRIDKTELPAGTSEVRDHYPTTNSFGIGRGYFHYLNLDSPSITPVIKAEDPARIPDSPPGPQPLNPVPADVAPAAEPPAPVILFTAARIGSLAVERRLEELEKKNEKPRVEIQRSLTREGQEPVIGRFATLEEAEKFIIDKDYRRARFYILKLKGELTPDEKAELARLRTLRNQGISRIGMSRWGKGITIYNESLLGAEWARAEALIRTGTGSLNQWPLNLLNWDTAAAVLRSELYYSISDGDQTWFLKIYTAPFYYGEEAVEDGKQE